ncbi:MAG: GNAT family N-acetyltransferase [bacterium]|nr:GNAT family N-acetyltransferase [bacterium]
MKKLFVTRLGKSKDIKSLVKFNYEMALETENRELDKKILKQGVKKVLKRKTEAFYLVTAMNKTVIASLMITKEWSDWQNGHYWWIQSVYVVPEYRRKGIYRKLYKKVNKIALKSKDCCGVRLYVEKDNVVAQKTYSSLNMNESDYKIFEAKI